MTKFFKREIRCVLHRKMGRSTVKLWTRHYSSIENALKKGVELSILTGQPGDVLEITDANFEFLIATLKLKVGVTKRSNMEIKFYLKD